MGHYFLSHKKTHSSMGSGMEAVAQGIHDNLQAMGYVGFFDVDNLDGINRQQLALSVQSSCSLVVLLHDETVDSEWCRFEWGVAKEHHIPVKCIVDTSICPKRAIIEQLKHVQPYLLEYQLVEYSP